MSNKDLLKEEETSEEFIKLKEKQLEQTESFKCIVTNILANGDLCKISG